MPKHTSHLIFTHISRTFIFLFIIQAGFTFIDRKRVQPIHELTKFIFKFRLVKLENEIKKKKGRKCIRQIVLVGLWTETKDCKHIEMFSQMKELPFEEYFKPVRWQCSSSLEQEALFQSQPHRPLPLAQTCSVVLHLHNVTLY